MKQLAKSIEDPKAVARYNRLKDIWIGFFSHGETVKNGNITESDVHLVRQFIAVAAQVANPSVHAAYWEQLFTTQELGIKVAYSVSKIKLIGNPHAVAFNLYIHNIGQLVTPGIDLSNDFIQDILFRELGVSEDINKRRFSQKSLLEAANKLGLSEHQLLFEKTLSEVQRKKADAYFASMRRENPEQLIENLVVILVKSRQNGTVSPESILTYFKGQEIRTSAVLQHYIVKQTLNWLEDNGITISERVKELKGYTGPTFEVFVRHGNTTKSKSGITYNRDDLTDEATRVDLDPISGKKQLEEDGEMLSSLGFKVAMLVASPQSRSKKSAVALGNTLVPPVSEEKIIIDSDINEVRASGPYQRGIKLDDWREMERTRPEEANIFSEYWRKYGHETLEELLQRFEKASERYRRKLKMGETVVFISHDSGIVAHYKNVLSKTSGLLSYADLDAFLKKHGEQITVGKGCALVFVRDLQGKIFTIYKLPEPSIASTQ